MLTEKRFGKMIRDVVLFDLDNTLFDVEQYMSGAFADVGAHLVAKHDVDRQQIVTDLFDIWRSETSMYSHLFDDLIDKHNIDTDVEQVVAVFNDHNPELEPYEKVPKLLDKLADDGYTLGIITDGTARRQKRKLDALNIRTFFDTIVLTAEIGEPKPSVVPFKKAAQRVNKSTEQCIYVGDNPQVDFAGAKESSMCTIRLCRGEFQHLPSGADVDKSVDNISALYKAINELSEKA